MTRKGVRVELLCDICDTPTRATGVQFCGKIVQWQHRCPKCLKEKLATEQYPIIIYDEV